MDRVEGDSCSSLHTEKRKTIRGKDEGVNLQGLFSYLKKKNSTEAKNNTTTKTV